VEPPSVVIFCNRFVVEVFVCSAPVAHTRRVAGVWN
jgi:hypothetical protein